MNDLVSHIITKAKKKGACDLINLCSSMEDLYNLYKSPQGREFCQKKNFPGYDLWKLIKRHFITKKSNLYIDEGRLNFSGMYNLSLIGNSLAKIECQGAEEIYKIQIQHGASVEINAYNYAVVVILNIGKGNRISIKKDNTARILWEGNLA